jgi:hypothetical protein
MSTQRRIKVNRVGNQRNTAPMKAKKNEPYKTK